MGDQKTKRDTIREMERGEHSLMKGSLNMIEFANDQGFEDHEYFRLTTLARERLLSDYDLINTKSKSTKEFLAHTSIPTKELCYNEENTQQVDRIESLLAKNNFKTIMQVCMAENGLRKGVACLFYGSSGTGKTETVYQIARKTGRHIMVIKLSEIKSYSIGESEKNIKAIFDRYRQYVKQSDVAPILLFDNADSLIGVRQESAKGGIDKMNHSIQNIILQEMETLDGIMIAITEDISQILDKTFERRFLYEIEFRKPSAETRCRIWRSMMPSLTKNEATELSKNHDLSGGQIENIARQRAIEIFLSGEKPTLKTLNMLCESETLYKCQGGIGPRRT